MEYLKHVPVEVEPVGIVIAHGGRAEQPPRFSAYMWSDAPEPPVESKTARRAA